MVEVEYAKAIYDLAIENNKEDKIHKQLTDFSSLLKSNPDFNKVMVSKTVARKEKKEIIAKVTKDFDPLFVDFLYVLIDNSRFGLLKDIVKQYKKRIDEADNIIHIDVTSSEELSEEELRKIKGSLEKKYPTKIIKINNIVDKSLIGGITITYNGENYDISLKRQLDVLKASL